MPTAEPASSMQGASNAHEAAKPLVSIVIPMHDSSDHIVDAVQSLLSQTYDNIEVICVDDASNDDTVSLVEGLAAIDAKDHDGVSRVRVIRNKRNMGPGATRNAGIKAAQGNYLYCLDSDDFVDPTLIQEVVDRFEQTGADMVCLAHAEYDDATGDSHRSDWSASAYAFAHPDAPIDPATGRMVVDDSDGVADGNRGLNPDLDPAEVSDLDPNATYSWRDNPRYVFHAVQNFPWNKALRMSYVRDNGILFQEDIRLTEDLMYAGKAIAGTDKMAFIEEPLVYHRVGTGKNVMAAKDKHPVDFLKAFLTLKKHLVKQGTYEEMKVGFANWAALGCLDNLFTLNTYEGYRKSFEALTRSGMRDLGLYDLPLEDYFFDGNKMIVNSLRDRRPKDAGEFAFANFKSQQDWGSGLHAQLMEQQARVAELEQQARVTEPEREARAAEPEQQVASLQNGSAPTATPQGGDLDAS